MQRRARWRSPYFSRSTASGVSTGCRSRPASGRFHQPSFDAAAWPAITVPAAWEVQGYGTPLYKNIGYYFKVDPPIVMGEPDPRYTTFK
jgi:beta-galactosidase/beta-glucuronidase